MPLGLGIFYTSLMILRLRERLHRLWCRMHCVAYQKKQQMKRRLLSLRKQSRKPVPPAMLVRDEFMMITYVFDVSLLVLSVLLAASETVCLNFSILAIYWPKSQTTSTLYVFLLAMVLYPEVQARAQAEIDSVIGEAIERLPDWDDRASMPYINAVIQETLRWFPVVPLGQYYWPHSGQHSH